MTAVDTPARLRDVPHAPRWPVLGSLPHLRSARTDILRETAERLGDIFALDLGRDEVLVIGHPADAARVLDRRTDVYVDRGGSTGFRRSSIPFLGAGLSTWNTMDAEWRRRRIGMGRILRSGSAIETHGGLLDGRPGELRSSLETLIVADLVRVLLGVEPPATELSEVADVLHRLAGTFWSGKYPGPHPLLKGRSRRDVERLESIAQRWADAGLTSGTSPLAQHVGALTAGQVRDEVLSQLLSAGTLAVPLLWGLDLLARNPDVQQRFRMSVVPDSTDAAYATWTLREIFRLCPSTYWIQRRAAKDDELSGVAVPRGTRVIIHIPRVHRHPDYWVEPDAFVPERFRDDAWKHAWMPFGRGARTCIARSYSLDAATRLLSGILRENEVKAVGQPLELAPGFSLVPRPTPRIQLIPLDPGQVGVTF